MAEQTNTGASNAADFQPPTNNPQSNVGGGVQPTTTNGSNVFNEPGVNAQAFPKTDSLKVISNNKTLQTQDSGNATPASIGWGTLTWVFVATLVVVAVLVLIVRLAKPAGSQSKAEVETPEPVIATPTKTKTKTKAKKKAAANKRKSRSKKRSRK